MEHKSINSIDDYDSDSSDSSDSKNKNKNKIIIPDELDIVIHTSIPFLGKFYYSPEMSIKNKKLVTQSQLIFNPLIKLNPSALKHIPDYETRVSHFFNRTSFESMVYNNSAMQPTIMSDDNIKINKNFSQYNNNINNNLTIVLDTIFEPNQIIYLGGKPFTILFYDLKEKKPRIKNKIGNYNLNPNETSRHIRDRLRKDGNQNMDALNNLHNEAMDLDDVTMEFEKGVEKSSNLFNNFKKQFFQGGGNAYNNYKKVKHLDKKLIMSDDNFVSNFGKLISNIFNNYNATATSDNKIVYFNKGIWHGLDNISTPKSVSNLFPVVNNIKPTLTEIMKVLLDMGIHIIIDNNHLNNSTNSSVNIHFTHDKPNDVLLYTKTRKNKNKNKTNNNSNNFTYKHNKLNLITGGGWPYQNNYYPYQNNYYPYQNNQGYQSNLSQQDYQFNPSHKMNYNHFLSHHDFDESSLNKFEIEVYVELVKSSSTSTSSDSGCLARRRKMIYNTKQLFSHEKLFDFTSVVNMDLYDSELDLSKIRPYLNMNYNESIDKKNKEKDKK